MWLVLGKVTRASVRIVTAFVLISVVFAYGVGVGKYAWPPHESIRKMYSIVHYYLPKDDGIHLGSYIVITLDDGKESDYTIAYPIMAERGIKGTSYITTSWIGKEGYLNWEQVKELMQAGWTIGCHSHTHPRLTALVDEDIHDELEKVNQAFIEEGLLSPLHHAYPHGDHDDRVVNIVQQYRVTARSTIKGYLTPDLHRMKMYPIYIQDPEYLEEVKRRIDYAVENERIIILLTHDISEHPSRFGTHSAFFEQLLDYIVEKNYETVTISEIYEIVERL